MKATSTQYETWAVVPVVFTPPSRLYSLDPIGIGTPRVESFASYIMRLAAAHSVSPLDLIRDEFAAEVSATFGDARRIGTSVHDKFNGTGRSTSTWVEAVETATKRNDLRYLTLLAFKDLISRKTLFRYHRAWCPLCYRAARESSRPIYDLLVWSIRSVQCCAVHNQALQTKCPGCNRPVKAFGRASVPGYCSGCGEWLGSDQMEDHRGAPTEYQRWSADFVGTLVANSGRAEGQLLPDNVRRALPLSADAMAGGNRSRLAKCASIRHASFDGWFCNGRAVALEAILHVWHELKLTASALLGEVDSTQVTAPPLISVEDRHGRPRRSRDVLRAELVSIADNSSHCGLPDVARRLGYTSTVRLYAVDKDLCDRIASEQRKHPFKTAGVQPIADPATIEKALAGSLANPNPPSVGKVAAALGYANSVFIRNKFPALCRAINEKITTVRNRQRALVTQELERALTCDVTPTLIELAQRLGFMASASLRQYAPELCDRILAQRREHKLAAKETLRKRMEPFLLKNPAPSISEIAAELGECRSNLRSCRDLFSALAKRNRQYCHERSESRRCRLQQDVRNIVMNMRANGECVRYADVLRRLPAGSLRSWVLVKKAYDDAVSGGVCP